MRVLFCLSSQLGSDRSAGLAIFPAAFLALATGMRRGELLALRRSAVDLESTRLRMERSLEQTKAGSLRFQGAEDLERPPDDQPARSHLPCPAT